MPPETVEIFTDPKVPISFTLPDIAPTDTSVPMGQRTSILPDFDLTSRTGLRGRLLSSG